MPIRFFLAALALVVSLVVAAFAAAQVPDPGAEPLVFSGEDLGFRVEGRRGDRALGRFVVRIDGEWVEVEGSFRVIPLK